MAKKIEVSLAVLLTYYEVTYTNNIGTTMVSEYFTKLTYITLAMQIFV